MIYVLLPRAAASWEDQKIFTTYSAAEQRILDVAWALCAAGRDSDWCTLVGYDGTDELYPMFVYTIVGTSHLHREKIVSPSP